MGTINYKTSEYITLAIRPYDAGELLKDPDFMEYLQEERPGEDPEEVAADEIRAYYEADEENAARILEKYDFNFFDVSIIPGYYEGLSIYIETKYSLYDDSTEKREAMKEATQIKQFLTEAAGVGFTACGPGWITSYYSYAETLPKIREAVKAIKDEIKKAPTYYTRRRAS